MWIFLTALGLCGLIHHLARGFATTCGVQLKNRFLLKLARAILPLSFVAFIHWRLNLLSLTIACAAVYLLYHLTAFLANRVASGRVNPENMPGRLGFLKASRIAAQPPCPSSGFPGRSFAPSAA